MVKEAKPQSMFYEKCPIHKATKEGAWSTSTPKPRKLYGCVHELKKTTILLTWAALIVYSAIKNKKN